MKKLLVMVLLLFAACNQVNPNTDIVKKQEPVDSNIEVTKYTDQESGCKYLVFCYHGYQQGGVTSQLVPHTCKEQQ